MRSERHANGGQGTSDRPRVFRRSSLRLLAAAVAVVLAAGASGCGDEKGVGDERLLDIEVQEGKNRLGETTTTVAPVTTTTSAPAPGKNGAASSTTTTARPASTTTTVPPFDITVSGDRAGTGQFEPRIVVVYSGTTIRWVNKDTVPRSVEADGGEFASPLIPPGQSWTYKAVSPGTINYHDGTRPYAVGTLEIRRR
jgi:plastocyanin